MIKYIPSFFAFTSAATLTKESIDGDWARSGFLQRINQKKLACMDGSVPAYYIQMSDSNSDEQPRKWLVYFEDGPICYDEESCDAMVDANPQVASSNDWPETRELGGIFSDTEDNELADYNKVLVGYCSGDGYLSNVDNFGRQGKFFGKYYMNGYGNSYALFDKLAEAYGFGAHPAGEDIVIGGAGNGAVGAMFTLEQGGQPFHQLIEDIVDDNGLGESTELRLLGLFDSALALDSPVEQLTELLGLVDQSCTEANVWECFTAEYLFEKLSVPAVILADQYDSVTSAPAIENIHVVQATLTRNYLNNFSFPSVTPVNGYSGSIFSPSCGLHGTTMTSEYYEARTGESEHQDTAVTYASDVINNAVRIAFGGEFDCSGMQCEGGVVVAADTCDGYQCSAYCDPAYVHPVVEPVVEEQEEVPAEEEETLVEEPVEEVTDEEIEIQEEIIVVLVEEVNEELSQEAQEEEDLFLQSDEDAEDSEYVGDATDNSKLKIIGVVVVILLTMVAFLVFCYCCVMDKKTPEDARSPSFKQDPRNEQANTQKSKADQKIDLEEKQVQMSDIVGTVDSAHGAENYQSEHNIQTQ